MQKCTAVESIKGRHARVKFQSGFHKIGGQSSGCGRETVRDEGSELGQMSLVRR